jgi:L-lactate permease
LADTITQIMILNAITPNLAVFFMNHFEVMGRINRFIFLRTGFFTTTQLEANLLYELPKPDFT